MNREWANRWADALESGKFTQGKGVLCQVAPDGYRHCCLGVLSEITNTRRYEKPSFVEFGRSQASGHLAPETQVLVGMNSCDGRVSVGGLSLAMYNDNGKTFTEIAKIIRHSWQEL